MSMNRAVYGPASTAKTQDTALVNGWPWWWQEVAAVATLIAVIVLLAWHLATGMIVGQDASTFFYPMFSFLGRELRAGHLPGWDPYQFSGMPFAGDPESGWMYLPAMIFFTFLPVAVAIKSYLMFHFLWQGLATYALARCLGYAPVGALSAGLLLALTTHNYEHTPCCTMYGQVNAWVPTLLLGTIVAVQARSWLGRVAAWGLGALALSQLLAAWLGQGTYYVFLMWGAFVVYLLIRQWLEQGWSTSSLLTVGHAVAIGAIGVLLSLGGLLPRFEANAVSTVPGGKYQGATVVSGGWTIEILIREFFNAHSGSYPGMAVLVLAGLAIVLAGWRLGVPYFLVLAVGALVLSFQTITPLHRLLYLLPDFQRLNQHQQQRVQVFWYMGLAFLAGAAINELWRRRQAWSIPRLTVEVAVLIPLLVLWLHQSHAVVARWSVIITTLTAILVIAARVTRKWWPIVGRILVLALLLLALTDNMHVSHGLTVSKGSYYTVNASEYFAPTGASKFLKAKAAEGWRYFGYEPELMKQGYTTYRFFFAYPQQFGIFPVDRLLVNNQATLLGVSDIQGYDPLQILRYADFIAAVNNQRQEYHEANVLPTGLSSQLLDVLGVRYVVLPANVNWQDPRLKPLAGLPVVYRDSQVQIRERSTAFPKAWIVHQSAWGSRSAVLSVVGKGKFNLRHTALTEEKVTVLAASPNPAQEYTRVQQQGTQQVKLQVKLLATGMVVLNDPYYPAWHAYIDGKPTKVYAVDGALRGVVVPRGVHTVEFRYEDKELVVGTIISTSTFVGLFIVILVLGWPRWRSRRRVTQ